MVCDIINYAFDAMLGMWKWSVYMQISYDKLWKKLIDKKMNRTDLKNSAGVSFNVLAKMGRNEFVSLESLAKICYVLECDIGEIVSFTNKI